MTKANQGLRRLRPRKSSRFSHSKPLRDRYRSHAEGPERHQHVDDDVEKRRAVRVGGVQQVAADYAGQQPEQHESHVRDGRVGEHALDVRLRDRGDVADRHGEQREERQHLLPVLRQVEQPVHQQPHRHRERGKALGAEPITSVIAVGAPW